MTQRSLPYWPPARLERIPRIEVTRERDTAHAAATDTARGRAIATAKASAELARARYYRALQELRQVLRGH